VRFIEHHIIYLQITDEVADSAFTCKFHKANSVPVPSWVLCHGCVNEDSLENAAVLQDCLWAWWLRNLHSLNHSLNLTTSRSQLTSIQALLRCMWWNMMKHFEHLNHIWTILWWYYLIRCYTIPNSARGRSCEAVTFFRHFSGVCQCYQYDGWVFGPQSSCCSEQPAGASHPANLKNVKKIEDMSRIYGWKTGAKTFVLGLFAQLVMV